mmetsp:Transcript_19810/g.35336  ORF Transcript_19810/g.35336 Transcript_19810/m.35336 type:complete len:496 (-) Transcript_19810:106-1593(-)|eukprot:CAMPEP_0197529678 /NCGR_PEP_ID=MMETSP1318-20131121/29232_1 /TAXON_ID=552666 /ORGANISM="Partenskyella glossopodia, Strain RCC365" /LENGTH=495 /DNA_ID=CAMNT_0043085241 /DNA_START=102 /DNA_END=1589 /DNA_ORIENTATION=-
MATCTAAASTSSDIRDLIADFEGEIYALDADCKRLKRDEARLTKKLLQKQSLRSLCSKESIIRRGDTFMGTLVSDRMATTPRSPSHSQTWKFKYVAKEEVLRKELAELEKETEMLKRIADNDSYTQRRLVERQEGLKLIYSDWNIVERTVSRIFKRHQNRDGTMDVARLVNIIGESKVSCLAFVPAVERMERPRSVTKEGFLARIRPRKNNDSKDSKKKQRNDDSNRAQVEVRRMNDSIRDLQRATEEVSEKTSKLETIIKQRTHHFKRQAAVMREKHNKAAQDNSVLEKQLKEESEKGLELLKQLANIEEKISPAEVPSNPAEFAEAKNELEEEKQKLEVNLAAMLAVNGEFKKRLEFGEEEVASAKSDLDQMKTKHMEQNAVVIQQLETKEKEIALLRDEMGIQLMSCDDNGQNVEDLKARSDDLLRRLHAASSLISARIDRSKLSLEESEGNMRSGLQTCKKKLEEMALAVGAGQELLDVVARRRSSSVSSV